MDFNKNNLFLIDSIKNNNYNITKLLIKNNCNVDEPDEYGFTPLIHSVEQQNEI